VSSAGVDSDGDALVAELRSLLEGYGSDVMADITAAWSEESRPLRGTPWGGPTLEDELKRAIAKQAAEAALFALNVQALTRNMPRSDAGAVINVYAPVGAIQTGAGSSAMVDQDVSSIGVAAALEVLTRIESLLPAIDDESLRPRLQELVRAGREEGRRPTPDGNRLRGILGGIATAVQTLGSAAPAYQFVKAALLPHGLILP
jgi:hypothetical protein